MEYHASAHRSAGGLGPRGVLAVLLVLLWSGWASALPEQKIPDGDIVQAIETEFWADDVVDPNAIDVVVDNGIVTLTGSVPSMLANERALKITEAIRGVRAVVDRLAVTPTRIVDDTKLQDAVQEALLLDPATEEFQVGVQAAEGVITLTGTVGSYQEKELCEAVVKGVGGVRGIIDHLDIRFDIVRSDREIQEEIVERMRNDVLVDNTMVTVSVADGIVNLYGAVGSLAMKNRAIWDAWVGGVHGVHAADLAVTWSDGGRDEVLNNDAVPSDQDVRAAVQDALLYDPRVVPFNPEVSVVDGEVTLRGVVDNLHARYAAESDAQNVVGVWRVKNFLKVRPDSVVADNALTARVEAALSRDPLLQGDAVGVRATAGEVQLSGMVGSRYEMQHAERVVAGVKGVVGVANGLTYPDTWVWKPDWQIRRDLEEALGRSSQMDARGILVTVDHGVVSLTGTVATWNERLLAEQKARAAGAREVHNDLTAADTAFQPSERPFLAPLPDGNLHH